MRIFVPIFRNQFIRGVFFRRSHAMVLLELMVALVLASILLSVLFRFFAGSVKLEQKISEVRKHLYSRQNLQTRLSFVFQSISPRPTTTTASSFFTLNDQAGLVAIFDNGVDPNPIFSGPILGRLYIDAGNLVLAMWPLEDRDTANYRKEILLSNVQNIRFQFLAKKSDQQPDPKAVPINASYEWRTDWPKNRWDIPSAVRLFIQQKNEEVPFAFLLPFLEPIPTYHEPVACFNPSSPNVALIFFETLVLNHL
jgi:type II secretory pathway pseudopilin PulG